VNAGLTLLYWHVGSRIRKEILQDERAEYGKKIVATVSRQLATDYGKGFLEKSLHRMIQFAEVFPDHQTIVSLTRQLCWSHFRLLIPLKDTVKRDFYAEMCRIERWNVRTLENKIDSMLFERTALSKRPELVAQAELDALRKDPLGLILCTGKQREQIELLELDQAGIHVAEYLTAFPSKEVLREKLQKAAEHARQRLENHPEEVSCE